MSFLFPLWLIIFALVRPRLLASFFVLYTTCCEVLQENSRTELLRMKKSSATIEELMHVKLFEDLTATTKGSSNAWNQVTELKCLDSGRKNLFWKAELSDQPTFWRTSWQRLYHVRVNAQLSMRIKALQYLSSSRSYIIGGNGSSKRHEDKSCFNLMRLDCRPITEPQEKLEAFMKTLWLTLKETSYKKIWIPVVAEPSHLLDYSYQKLLMNSNLRSMFWYHKDVNSRRGLNCPSG